MPPSPKHGQASNPPEKKKRRQNVACDSCRLRRVKCDMLALLTPADSTRVMPPLPVLVRQNPDVSCSNCISKGIRCTTNQIVNPSKPNKGGKRIEEAKKMYGSEGLLSPSAGNTAAPPTPLLSYEAPLPTRHDSGTTTRTSASSASSSSYDLSDTVPSSVDLTNGVGADFLFGNQYPYSGTTDLLNQGASGMGGPNEHAPRWTTEWSSNAVSTAYGTPFAGGVYDMSQQAANEQPIPPLWNTDFLFPQGANAACNAAQPSSYNPPPSLYVSSAEAMPNLIPSSLSALDDMNGASSDPSAFSSVGSDGTLHTPSDHPFRSSSSGDSSPVPPPPPQPRSALDVPAVMSAVYPMLSPSASPSASGSATATATTAATATVSPPQIVGRKRQHADDDVMEIVRKDGKGDEKDPWSLWANSKAKEDKIIRWSRSNHVGDELASRALGSELSRHLVQVYFSSVHLTLPAISPEAFYMSWQQAGERSDRMTPAQEVLCAVIEAWAARFSDHPVVLGIGPNKQHNPKLILAPKSGEIDSLIDQAEYGQKRLRVCFALVERARKLIDEHGILRKPSLTGVQALALFTQLQHMTDHNPDAPEHLMESEMLHTMLVQQLRKLDGCWVAEGSVPISKDDGPTTAHEQRIKQRRLWWTVFIADSFWAAGTCSKPVIPEEDIKASREWLEAINPGNMPSSFESMAFFMSCFHHIATLTRAVANQLALPCKRPGRVDVAEFCKNTRVIWKGVRDLYQEMNGKVEEVLSLAKEEILGFSPVHQFCSLRLATTYILLIMQQIIQQLLDFRKRLHEAYIFDDNVPLQAQPEAARVSALKELHAQSIDILLANVRAQTPLFETLHPTGFMQGASMIARVSLAAAQFLSEVPTNEQGYPNHTRGGVDWTWENKQAEVDSCVKALRQLGWAWADVSPVLSKIKMNMARMTPSDESLLSYAFEAQNISESAAQQAARRQSDGRRDSQALDAVLEFWPPASVPKKLRHMDAEQYAVRRLRALDYGRGNFEYQPIPLHGVSLEAPVSSSSLNGATNETPVSLASAMMNATPRHSCPFSHNPLHPVSEDYTFGSSGGIGSSTAAGWAAHGAGIPTPGPEPEQEVVLPGSDLADFADFTDARLQADLESFLETFVGGMQDMGEPPQ